ncbi:NAC domain-containing protein 102-like [Pyrus ussuriensis x Pyrus communis]|uniref:NAC domain-containing protein 102-like n=1 Tax=Pyrus ussuriensis x Pyrus communis TaxID=2448454 RepID=A0A5N5FVP2_9ROSA|nr:NAC domain-containing protein 102-like [Pyrus ussuriensis x Pyrus communis]
MEINHSLVPSCFRFKPTDQELIGRFLRYFLVETPQLLPPPPHHTFMHKCNLFGNHSEPSEIWEAFGGGGALQLAAPDQPALYFFSELTKKTPNGSNIVRKMGRNGGKWDGKAVPAWVEGTDGTSTCIGLKRTFCYKNVCSEDHGAWLLDEYSLFAAPRNRKSHTSYDFDYVLCRLRKTSDNNNRKCPRTSSSEDDQVTASTKNSINKRKCPTSSSSEDQVTTSNKRTKKKSANEEIEGDNDQELLLPADSGIAADGAVEENVWDPSLLEKYLLETHEEEPLNPSFYKEWIAADGGVQEAYHPNAYENVLDQSYYGSSYPNNACLEDQFMPPINIAQEIL